MKYLSLLFVIFIVAVIVLADNGNLPGWTRALYDFPNGDKLGHFILFGLLNFSITLTFLRSFPDRSSKWVALSIGLILALLIGVEEFSQKYFSARTFDLIDLLASYFGVAAGGWIAFKLKN